MPGESGKAYDAFCFYLDMGSDRTLDAAWRKFTIERSGKDLKGNEKATSHWRVWCGKFSWPARCKAHDDRQVEVKRKIKEEEEGEQYRIEIRENLRIRRERIKQLRAEQWDIGCKLQELAKAGINALAKTPDKMSGADIVKTLQSSFEFKKQSLGVTNMPALDAIVTLADDGLLPPEMIEFFEEAINEPITITSEKISELYIERLKNE